MAYYANETLANIQSERMSGRLGDGDQGKIAADLISRAYKAGQRDTTERIKRLVSNMPI